MDLQKFLGTSPNTQLSLFNIVPIVEFAAISFVIIATYLALHTLSSEVKPALKVLSAMFIGTSAYMIGKVFVLTIIIHPLFG